MTEREMRLTLEVKELRLELAAAKTNRDEWKTEALRLRKEKSNPHVEVTP